MGIWGILESIGIVGALTALIKLARDIRDSHVPLVMKARQFHVVWYEDNCAIVVFELSFVNDSSQKRTVDNVQVSLPPVIIHRQYPFVPWTRDGLKVQITHCWGVSRTHFRSITTSP